MILLFKLHPAYRFNFKFLLWLLSPALFFLTSCSFDNEEDLFADEICLTDEVSYQGTIKPLIDNSCIACHNSSLPSGNINLEDYNHIKPLLENGRFLGFEKGGTQEEATEKGHDLKPTFYSDQVIFMVFVAVFLFST